MKKERLDVLLVERGLVETRSKAQALIMSGLVFVNDEKMYKPGVQIEKNSVIVVKKPFEYVSRGATKIAKAYEFFNLNFCGKVICDIGSSTGGFTDFALQKGAQKVYAIDVGRGQLDQKLRKDPRVIVMEETDFRKVEKLDDKIDYFLCDVSFISLKKIIPHIGELVQEQAEAILLIKPQFEVGKKEADRGKGVIRDQNLRDAVIEEVKNFSEKEGFKVVGIVESPIKGAKGNVEYLIYLKV